MEYAKSITKEEINELPPLFYEGELEVLESPESAARALELLAKETLLGFDTETRPSFVKGQSYPVSLLQLATAQKAYLFRLRRTGVPEQLRTLLSDPGVIKAGVGIQDDLLGLQKLMEFRPAGFVDLAKEAEKRGVKNFGLRPLTAIFLGKRLLKGAKLTNWDRPKLSLSQLHYAANDALVGLLIYQRLMGAKA